MKGIGFKSFRGFRASRFQGFRVLGCTGLMMMRVKGRFLGFSNSPGQSPFTGVTGDTYIYICGGLGSPKTRHTFLGCNEDYSIWGSILGSPYLGEYHIGVYEV